MEYVAVGILVLLIVTAGVTFFVLSATRRQRGESAADSDHGRGTPGSEAAIVTPDDQTPLGDTDQLSGEQAKEGGRTGAGGSAGGEGGLGGEAEGGRGDLPDSERLADRPR